MDSDAVPRLHLHSVLVPLDIGVAPGDLAGQAQTLLLHHAPKQLLLREVREGHGRSCRKRGSEVRGEEEKVRGQRVRGQRWSRLNMH